MRNRFIHLLIISLLMLFGVYYGFWMMIASSLIYLISNAIYKKDWISPVIFILLSGVVFGISLIPFNNQVKQEFEGRVVEYSGTSMIVNDGFDKYYVNINESININVGDVVKVSGYFERVEEGSFRIHLLSNGTDVSGFANTVEIVEELYWTPRNAIFNNIVWSDTLYSKYASVMFYGVPNSSEAKSFEELLREMGVSHIIVISGFHIALIMNFIERVLLRFKKISKGFAFSISSIFGLLFIYFTFGSKTSMRAWVYKNILWANDKFFWNLTRNNALAITALIFLLFNPFSLMTLGMTLSFGISFLINMISELKIRKIFKLVLISLGTFVFATPFISTFDNSFNLTSPLISILITIPISLLYSVMIIFLPFKFLWPILDPIIWVFNNLLNALSYLIFTIDVSEGFTWVGYIFGGYTFVSFILLKEHPPWITVSLISSVFALSVV